MSRLQLSCPLAHVQEHTWPLMLAAYNILCAYTRLLLASAVLPQQQHQTTKDGHTPSIHTNAQLMYSHLMPDMTAQYCEPEGAPLHPLAVHRARIIPVPAAISDPSCT